MQQQIEDINKTNAIRICTVQFSQGCNNLRSIAMPKHFNSSTNTREIPFTLLFTEISILLKWTSFFKPSIY